MSRTARLRVKLRKRVKRVRKFTRKIAKRPLRGYHRARAKNAAAVRYLRHLIDDQPLRDRALAEAERCVGVMEEGGNNVGVEVEEIIAEGGGLPGQAWCGWFCAAMYKRAGSQLVTWQMGAVRLWLSIKGVKLILGPKPGDPVRYWFDHIGMFVRWLRWNGSEYVPCGRFRATHIEAIEGNTGATGAVSDSATGGDGVYRKVRERSLVRDFLRVTR